MWFLNSGPVNTNNDISVYTTTISNGILRAVPINVGNEVISITCILTAPVFYQSLPATLTIIKVLIYLTNSIIVRY